MPHRGQMIRDAMTARDVSQKELARLCGCSAKTIQRALSGWMSEKTAKRLMGVFGDDLFKSSMATVNKIAHITHGSYARHAVEEYIGDYLCARRTFIDEGKIFISHMSIWWSDERCCLCFEKALEQEKMLSGEWPRRSVRIKYCQGDIYFSLETSAVHLLACNKGSVLVITATRLDEEETMRGIVLTATELDAPGVHPACAPIVMQKLPYEDLCSVINNGVEVHDLEEADAASVNLKLAETENTYAIFSLIEGGKGIIEKRYRRRHGQSRTEN